jgi:hypothetical protein
MIRIAISEAAYEAISRTLPLGTVAFEQELNEHGRRHVWLEPVVVDRLGALRGPSETHSDVILRLAAAGG